MKKIKLNYEYLNIKIKSEDVKIKITKMLNQKKLKWNYEYLNIKIESEDVKIEITKILNHKDLNKKHSN